MREVLPELLKWWRRGDPIGMGTVVATWRSAPRPVGAAMLVGPGGEAIGSVSGGCVESAVYELARKVVADGRPTLQRYGISDDDAFGVGLPCGGMLDVFVERVDRTTLPQLEEVTADIADGRAVAVCTLVKHPDAGRVGAHLVVRPQSASWTTVAGSLGSPRFDAAVADDAPGLLANGRSGILTYGPDGERRGEGAQVFVASHAPRPRMIVFGAIDFAAALARSGTFLGYRVTVCDARPLFATRSRFPDADEVVVDWPHRYLRAEIDAGRIDARTVLAVLTHDPKFDVPVLEIALRLPDVGYIGAMGSRRTHQDRLERLRAAGVSDAELARLSSPIGLDLGARTAEETAISIAAEIIALRWGGQGDRLSQTRGAIHHRG
ncbi:XdhC family protein [Micromonospora sp. NPDC005806]|uniref:XdhC family protein n=1 Tax=Micromonospora sp. NPDC005806 TaxID=3364234 RepID=UPI0036BF2BF8